MSHNIQSDALLSVHSLISTLFRDPFFDVEIRSSAFCGMLETNSPLLELSSLIFFLLPFFIMVYLYICMSVKIRKSTKIILGFDRHELDKRHTNRRAILKMLGNKSKVMLYFSWTHNVLASVVICFFISLAPFHAQRLMYVLQVYRLINELQIF